MSVTKKRGREIRVAVRNQMILHIDEVLDGGEGIMKEVQEALDGDEAENTILRNELLVIKRILQAPPL